MIVAGMISIKRRLYIQSINAKSDQDWYERGIEPLNISKRRNIKDYANSKKRNKTIQTHMAVKNTFDNILGQF